MEGRKLWHQSKCKHNKTILGFMNIHTHSSIPKIVLVCILWAAALKTKKKGLSVNIFNTKVVIEDTVFMYPTGDEITISTRGHLSHAKV